MFFYPLCKNSKDISKNFSNITKKKILRILIFIRHKLLRVFKNIYKGSTNHVIFKTILSISKNILISRNINYEFEFFFALLPRSKRYCTKSIEEERRTSKTVNANRKVCICLSRDSTMTGKKDWRLASLKITKNKRRSGFA